MIAPETMSIEKVNSLTALKGILCEVPLFGESALHLSYSVGVMASCNYIPQIMFNSSP